MRNWNHVLERTIAERFPELPESDKNIKTYLVIEW